MVIQTIHATLCSHVGDVTCIIMPPGTTRRYYATRHYRQILCHQALQADIMPPGTTGRYHYATRHYRQISLCHQALQADILTKSRDHKALNKEGRSLIESSDTGQQAIIDQLQNINDRWEVLTSGMGSYLVTSHNCYISS